MIGIVKWFNAPKGYGFLRADEYEYFVHITSIQRSGLTTLLVGQRVEFDIETDPRSGKTSAINIRLIKSNQTL